MVDPLLLALVSGGSAVAGSLVGAAASLVAQGLNTKAARRQERIRLTVQTALADHQSRLDAMKAGLLGPGQRVPPMPTYLDYHSRILAALDKGLLTPEKMRDIHNESRLVKEALDTMPGYVVPKNL
jgi:hypothetical protein